MTSSASANPSPANQVLKVSANGHYFETADGKPWFWLGDTAWTMFTAYTPDEARRYLEARAKLGFNLVQVSPVFDGGTGTEKGINPNQNTDGIAPWSNHDPLQPNEAFWKNVDAAVKIAQGNGIHLGLLPCWGSYVANTKMLTLKNAKPYGKWLGARYKDAPNIVWIVGGDRPFAGAPEIWTALAEGLQEGDGGAHPITYHTSPDGCPTPAAVHQAPWLSASMLQTWAFYDNIPAFVSADYKAVPPKPVILGEGAYEEGPEYPSKPITPLSIRKQGYWACLSGGFYTYGHNDMWRHNSTWEKSLSSPGAHDMQVMREIFAGIDWWNLVPAQEILGTSRKSGMDYNAAARSSDNKWVLLYLSHATTVDLRLEGDLAKLQQATWINPATGERTDAGKIGASATTPAGWEDALLELKEK